MVMGVQMRFSAGEFLAEARRMTGIDIVDVAAAEPLGIWLNSLNEESALHAAGAAAMGARILHLLCNRLRMQRDFLAHPEIVDQKIVAPIFFCGMGRTGSTKTHRLISKSEDFNFVTYWRVFNPCLLSGDRGEDPTARIKEAQDYVAWFDGASPELKFGHQFEPMEPEEESLILEHSLLTPVMLGWSPVNGYLGWLMGQDMTAQFSYLRDTLKYLQWQGLADPGKRWVLKSPLYTGLEAPLLKVFPDARLVMTHRHPNTIIASGLRVMELFYKPFTAAPVDGPFYLAGQAGAIEAHLRNRAEIANFDVMDVAFRELTGDVGPVVERIYDFVGAELTEVSRQRMLDWDTANPQHKNGKFVYALAEYGLTEARIEEMFAPYIAFLRARGLER